MTWKEILTYEHRLLRRKWCAIDAQLGRAVLIIVMLYNLDTIIIHLMQSMISIRHLFYICSSAMLPLLHPTSKCPRAPSLRLHETVYVY